MFCISVEKDQVRLIRSDRCSKRDLTELSSHGLGENEKGKDRNTDFDAALKGKAYNQTDEWYRTSCA